MAGYCEAPSSVANAVQTLDRTKARPFDGLFVSQQLTRITVPPDAKEGDVGSIANAGASKRKLRPHGAPKSPTVDVILDVGDPTSPDKESVPRLNRGCSLA